MSRVIHFEIQADDPERATRFYGAVFGWSFQKWGGPQDYWVAMTGPDEQPGINGGILRRRGPAPLDGQPVNAFVCTLATDRVDAATAAIVAHGGQVVVPKMAIPGVGWLAYAKDTEGNIFGVMQHDRSAA